jgi:hypothetical protein
MATPTITVAQLERAYQQGYDRAVNEFEEGKREPVENLWDSDDLDPQDFLFSLTGEKIDPLTIIAMDAFDALENGYYDYEGWTE